MYEIINPDSMKKISTPKSPTLKVFSYSSIECISTINKAAINLIN
jgi:hypothetical protein